MILNKKMILFRSILCLLFVTVVNAGIGSLEAKNRIIGSVRNDSMRNELYLFSYEQIIIPAALMVYGTIEALSPKFCVSGNGAGHEFCRKYNGFQISDLTQYVPAASVYALNFAGIKGKHSIKEMTAILGIAGLFTTVMANGIKYTVREQRPDRSADNSFPSGHTAIAFMGAEFLRREYSDVSVWYGVAGYSIAVLTGALRMYKNKHWEGDVVFGAGLGIICTKAAFWLYPGIKKSFSKKNKPGENFVLLPYYDGQQKGFNFSIFL
jgi:membrane-associated phospholipid phosphatase